MNRCTALMLTLAVVALGCGRADVTAPSAATLQGTWSGIVDEPASTTVTFVLVDEGAGQVSGTVEIGDLMAPVSGVFSDPHLRLDVELTLSVEDSLWFDAQLTHPDTLQGFSHSRVVVTFTDPEGMVREEVQRDSASFVAGREP